MGKRYSKQRSNKKRKEVSSSEWQQLTENAVLREAYTQFASEVQLAQHAAEERSRASSLPLSATLDLRGAGRILDTYPQLVRYLDHLRDREANKQDALTRPDIMLSSPTGSTRIDPNSTMGGWAGTSTLNKDNPVGINNARQLREWAKDEWVKAALDFRAEKVARADIAVLPADERKPYDRKALKDMQLILDQPNELKDTWPMLVGMFVRDFDTLGQGVFTKSMTPARLPTALYCEDAANIKIYPQWSGDPNEPRYLFQQGGYGVSMTKVPLRNDEAIVAFNHPTSYNYGEGPVQTLANTILADLKATEMAKRMADSKPPPTAIQLQGYTAQQIQKLRSDYESEIAGQREILFFGGNGLMNVKSLIYSMRDQQFMEYQLYLVKKICAVFQVTSSDLGLVEDVNRATALAQQDISESKGFLPLLLTVEEYLNREFLADYAPRMKDGRTNLATLNLRIVFPEVSEAARMFHAEKAIDMATKSLAGLPSQTINQVLAIYGAEPLPGGNTLYVSTKNGPIPWLSYDNDFGSYIPPLGTQDPSGGVDDSGIGADDQSGDDMGKSDGGDNSERDAVQQVQDTTQAQSGDTSGGNSEGGSTSSTKRYTASQEMLHRQQSYVDNRKPGRHWTPSNMQRREEVEEAEV